MGWNCRTDFETWIASCRSKLNKQIAFELGASERTIKAHRHNIMQKLQVQSFAEAVAMAERLGLVAAPMDGNQQ
jgi:DNA-binding NarL/FixJ family response regulator